MRATAGDQLVIKGHHVGEPDRDAEILEVHGEDGAPPYLVRWADDGHEGLVFPGPDASIRHLGEDVEPGVRGRALISETEAISLHDCLDLLRSHDVGRVAFLKDELLTIVPVNFKFVDASDLNWIAFRTRIGGILDRSSLNVAFEIDEIEDVRHAGWSVMVRGTLHHVDPDAADFRERFNSEPWIVDRDAWMVIHPFSIEGRRVAR